jgi:hypothetical protein
MLNNESVICPDWIYSMEWSNASTIEDVNRLFMVRNIPGLIFVCTLMVTGILGNALVLYIFGTRFARSNYRTYVLCLALLDEISSCIVMPFIIVYLIYPKNFPGSVLCKFGHFVGYYTSTASAFVLILIAIDRYRKICQPLKRQISKRLAQRSCLIINIMSLVISIQSPIIYGTSTNPTGISGIEETVCFMENNKVDFGKAFYIQLQVCLAFVIVFITILYFQIMQKLDIHRRESISRLSRQTSGPKIIRTRKTTITFIVITSIFAISSEIHHALAMILHFVRNLECHMNRTEGSVFYFFLWTVFINNVSNPFIYGVSDDRFRKHLREILKRRVTNNRRDSMHSGSSITE